jgi:hypothetical protein
MRHLLVVLLVLGVAGLASAANLTNTLDLSIKGQNSNPAYDGREGGEDTAGAFVIASLPFSDTGATCDNIDDYDEICPYSGSTSPDVVYSYTPASNEAISVDLCNSSYDTKVYIYESVPGNLVACNDDAGCGYSGYQSLLDNISLTGGVTYYIVVDGYGGSCGEYILDITGFAPCVVDCPEGAQLEGEPPCQDGYVDGYNGGCNSVGWTLISGDANGCAVVCGESCTYIAPGGLGYRDTDWYEATAGGGPATASCTAEFPLQFIFIWGADCNNLQYDLGTAGPCTPVILAWNFNDGDLFWLWVGASVFDGVPASDYVLDVCGLQGGGTATYETSWGAIKGLYR